MIFLLDENFPKSAVSLLRQRGHVCLDLRDIGASGTHDKAVFETAIDRNAVLLTTDRDFFHTVPHLYADHPGVIVIALRQPNRRNILQRLEWFLDRFSDTSMRNRVFELRDRTYVVAGSK